jgi:hypothetical protein
MFKELDEFGAKKWDWWCSQWNADVGEWDNFDAQYDQCTYNRPIHRTNEYMGCVAHGKKFPDTGCVESDGGNDIYNYGVVSDFNGNYRYDLCAGHYDEDIIEHYCSNGKIITKRTECPNGCFDGACKEEEACIQKDNTCCKGDKCLAIAVDCVAGSKAVFNGCNGNCQPDWSCVPYDRVNCKESDDGLDYFTPGKVSSCVETEQVCDDQGCSGGGGCGVAVDKCLDSETLLEQYCKGDQHYSEKYICPNGCDGAACRQQEGSYTYLDKKFWLKPGDSVKVKDYRYMKIKLTGLAQRKCVDCKVEAKLHIEMPGTCYPTKTAKSPITGNVVVSGGGGSSSAVPAESPELEVAPSAGSGGGGSSCGGSGVSLYLLEGESKNVFGAQIKFIETDGNKALFIVKSGSSGLVDISVEPVEQSINYDEEAVYKITVQSKYKETDGDPIPYSIYVKGLPFEKDYLKEIKLEPGSGKTFNLVVKPYRIVEPEKVKEEKVKIKGNAITGNVVYGKAIAIPEGSEDSPVAESEEEVAPIVEPPRHLAKRYKFTITVVSQLDENIQDSETAMLMIKPKNPTKPPKMPGEQVGIRLFKGWNLISLPGKLVRFDNVDLDQKPIAYVWIKDKQEYMTIQEAEEYMGTEKLRAYLAQNAFWIYSKSAGKLSVSVDRELSYDDLRIVKGWNLVPITDDMIGGYLADIIGDCEVDKLHIWDAKAQQWESSDEDHVFSNPWYGFLLKAKDFCSFSGAEVIAPPAMPE